MNRRVLVALADMHSGHKLGFCHPDTILWDEDQEGNPVARSVSLGKFQEFTYDYVTAEVLPGIVAFADGAPIVLVHDGDLTHGIVFMPELCANTFDDQTQIAFWNLKPWMELPNVVAARLVTGTDVHTFDGSSEAVVTRLLRAAYPDIDVRAVNHMLLSVNGAMFDIAHHGASPSIRTWLQGNQLRYYLRDIMLDALSAGKAPPSVVLRAHYHQWIPHEVLNIYSGGVLYQSIAMLLPCLCGLTSHGRKVTKSINKITIGCVAVEVIDGKIGRIAHLIKVLDLRTKEDISD
jgi:hypothetical protein